LYRYPAKVVPPQLADLLHGNIQIKVTKFGGLPRDAVPASRLHHGVPAVNHRQGGPSPLRSEVREGTRMLFPFASGAKQEKGLRGEGNAETGADQEQRTPDPQQHRQQRMGAAIGGVPDHRYADRDHQGKT